MDSPMFFHIKETFSSIITNKLQRYTICFIAVNALHVSGGFSAHHQELYIQHLVYVKLAVCTAPDDGRKTA
jgi:hypothetical protein